MQTTVEGTLASEYGWADAQPEGSHAYLDPVVTRALAEVAPADASRSGAIRIFDAGCGNGALLLALRNLGYGVGGCELSAAGTEIARRSLGGAAQIEAMSVYDDLAATFGGNWDAVVSTEVIEHLYAPRIFLQRAKALLEVGGALVLSTPYHGYLKNLAMAVTGSLDGHFTALWDGGHIKFWSYSTLKALLLEAGFGEFRFAGAGRLPGLWKSMVVTAVRLR
ncbi:MAG TPA: methyltransferase domain-containing protein [Steroidobacteraceae bacterium]|nr:methyltransferase domain-containing protein [Steroidobacteraceae bacterium]